MKKPLLSFSRLLLLIVFTFALLSQPKNVSAASITVDRTDDDASASACTAAPNDCSLRGAVRFANTNPGFDTINLPAGTYTLSIGGYSEDSSLTGDLDFTDGNGLSIIGENADTTIINQTITDRVLEARSGNLTLRNLTISGGNTAIGQNGGGLYAISAANITIASCTFRDNIGERGSGLYILSGTVNISDSLFTNNDSREGSGGIHNNDSLTVTDSSISNNTTGSGGWQGAGIFNTPGSDLSVENTQFLNNIGSGAGAGIANQGTATLKGCTFQGNQTSSMIGGGGVYNYNIMTASNCTFAGNHATQSGGGIINSGTLTLTNSSLTGNSANNGGGIFNTSNLTLTNSSLVNNSAASNGNEIYSDNMTFLASLKNNIIANETPGKSCYLDSGTNSINSSNLAVDSTCDAATQTTNTALNLGTLTDRGGPSKVIPLLEGSAAIDAGDPAVCAAAPVNNLDQRGFTRPLDGNGDLTAVCDVGAYETGTAQLPEVESANLDALYTTTGPLMFNVTFNKDMQNLGGGSGEDDVTNPANYLLVEAGNNRVFDTVSCGPVPGAGGVKSDDVQITINQVTYNSTNYTSNLTINNAVGLPAGSYRLFLCATSTLRDLGGQPLNSGVDVTYNFTVSEPETTLPATGFPQGSISALPVQPAEDAYTSLDMLLEIPSQNIQMNIIGVPAAKDGWDVTWLEDNAGYLEGSAFPTWEGNTVLTGHVWTANNQPGPFANLKSLNYGDQVLIHAWGITYIYEVRETNQIKPGDLRSVMLHKDTDWLTLLTCETYDENSGSYLSRRLVRAVLVNAY